MTTTLLELSEFTPTGEVVEEGAAVGDGQVLLRWYCGAYVSAPVWRGDSYEPDECGTELYTLEDVGEVADGQAQAARHNRNWLTPLGSSGIRVFMTA